MDAEDGRDIDPGDQLFSRIFPFGSKLIRPNFLPTLVPVSPAFFLIFEPSTIITIFIIIIVVTSLTIIMKIINRIFFFFGF